GRLGGSGTGDNEGMFGAETGVATSQQEAPPAAGEGASQEGWASQEAVAPGPPPAPRAPLPDGRYFDREESWLRFNQRVLELAEDEGTPLLERVRFLAIFASNLDEFFMVRVAGRIRRMSAGLPVESASGMPPTQILENTLETARELAVR